MSFLTQLRSKLIIGCKHTTVESGGGVLRDLTARGQQTVHKAFLTLHVVGEFTDAVVVTQFQTSLCHIEDDARLEGMACLPVITQIQTNAITIVIVSPKVVFNANIRDQNQPLDGIGAER